MVVLNDWIIVHVIKVQTFAFIQNFISNLYDCSFTGKVQCIPGDLFIYIYLLVHS